MDFLSTFALDLINGVSSEVKQAEVQDIQIAIDKELVVEENSICEYSE